ncbi:MAG: LAGLIDADG family homing endonuclease [Candidatus Woesearchaeota archaeon]
MAEKEPFKKISAKEKYHIKHMLKELESIRGRHTELITLYIPAGYDINAKIAQIQQEQGTATNIKSKNTRDNVIASLEKMAQFLRGFKTTPPNGLMVFSGNAAEREGQQDYRVWSFEPPVPLKQNLYRCDKEFVLDPMRDMIEDKILFGLVVMDKREGNIAMLKGKTIIHLDTMTSAVPGKTKSGGQCLVRDSAVQLGSGNIVSICETHNPLAVKSMVGDYIGTSDITDKWEVPKEEVYTITTKYPRLQVSCSKDHIFFVRTSSGIVEKSASELKVEDALIMPEIIDVKGVKQKLVAKDYVCYIVSKDGLNEFISKRKELNLSQKKFGEISDVPQSNISAFERGVINFTENVLNRLLKNLGLENFSKYLQIRRKVTLPKVLDKNVAQFIGYYFGDGCSEDHRITLFEQRKDVALEYKQLGEKLFNVEGKCKFRESKNYYQIRFDAFVIVKFLKDNFPELKKALDSCVPKKIMESSNDVVAGFLKGLFDAEGYVVKDKVGIGLNNKKTIQTMQMMFLRFGIISSFLEYDNNRNKYSNNIRYSLQITDKESLEIFQQVIGFTAKDKSLKLKKCILNKTDKSSVRQIVVAGSIVRKLIEKFGYNSEKYAKANMFLRDKREISKVVFKKIFIEGTKDVSLKSEFQKIYARKILPVKISSIDVKKEKNIMIDISTSKQNFIANCLIVHNSAQRFERLRDGAAIDFYKRIAESMKEKFLDNQTELQGIIIGGPGFTKFEFADGNYINETLKRKIIAVKDISYTGEFGVTELVERSEDVLAEEEVIKEKQLMRRFFELLSKASEKAAYGFDDVLKYTEMGAVETILVSEELDDNDIEILEKASDLVGTNLEIISVETREGVQLRDMGKVVAILRYSVE